MLRTPRDLWESFGGGLSANFWKLWGSTVASNLAEGVMTVVLPIIAVRLTDSPAEVAGVAVAAQIPMLLFGLPAGGLADRLDRRLTMLAVQLLRIAVLATLAVLAVNDALSMVSLYAAAFIVGTGEAFFDTNAQSIIPQLVTKDRLVTANGRLFAAETLMNSFVGPPIGGLLVAVSTPLALSGSLAGFVIAAAGLLIIRGSFRPDRQGPTRRLHVEIGEGLGYLLRHRLLLTLTSMVAMGRLGSSAIFAIFALYAVAPGPMGLSEPEYGILFVTFGLGSLIGSFLAARVVALLGRAQVLALAQGVFGLGILAPALTANAWVVGAGFFIAGVAVMAWNITNVSLRQAILPTRLMGRVHASHRFIANLAGLLGAVAAGVVGEAIGLRAAFAIGALVVLISIAGRLVVTDERIAAAEVASSASVPVAS
ncbi:MAG: MFS transporter [Candidatus Limnocylindria bacterium]